MLLNVYTYSYIKYKIYIIYIYKIIYFVIYVTTYDLHKGLIISWWKAYSFILLKILYHGHLSKAAYLGVSQEVHGIPFHGCVMHDSVYVFFSLSPQSFLTYFQVLAIYWTAAMDTPFTHPLWHFCRTDSCSGISKLQVIWMFKFETDTGGNFMSSLRISKCLSSKNRKMTLLLMTDNLKLRDMEKKILEMLILNNTWFPWKEISQDCSILLNFPFKDILFYQKYFISRNSVESLPLIARYLLLS